MFVSGGDTLSAGFTDAMLFRSSNFTWETLTPLKTKLAWHCMSQMDSVTIVVTGGYTDAQFGTYSKKSYFFNIITKSWASSAPDLKIPRTEHGCSFITGQDGQPTAIIVGGHTTGLIRQETVEIYNRTLNIWESGTPFPKKFSNMVVTHFTSRLYTRILNLSNL